MIGQIYMNELLGKYHKDGSSLFMQGRGGCGHDH